MRTLTHELGWDRRMNVQEKKRKRLNLKTGAAEVAVGIALLVTFYVTWVTQWVPYLWAGALALGLILTGKGIFDFVRAPQFPDFKKGMQPTFKELRFTLRKIRESPLLLVGVTLVSFFIAIAILAPVLAPPVTPQGFPLPDPFEIYFDTNEKYVSMPQPPSAKYPFGTTTGAINLYYGCIWGTIYAFRLGIIVIAATLSIGISLGLIAAYYGGLMDEIIMRFTDIVLAFPGLILTMALIVALSRRGWSNIDAAILGITLVGWPGYTRLIRGEVLRVKTEDYVEASRASGSSDLRIMLRHILPNAIYPIIIVASLDFGSIVLFAAALSFLGLGAPPRYADWGQLISQAQDWISYGLQYWWTFIIPGVFITLFCLGWNLLGDAFRDILDPLYRRK